MVLPIGEIDLLEDDDIEEEALQPTRTYKLDLVRGVCSEKVDGREAMEQAIYKIMKTILNRHLIYEQYGFENMMGQEELFVRGELPRRIEEALLEDDRITEIKDLELEFVKDECYVSLTAVTIFGDVKVLREEMLNV